MKKVISKLDKKEYYIAVASNCENSDFIEGKRYQVRKATKDDCENSELYCKWNFLGNVTRTFISSGRRKTNDKPL